MPRPHTLAEVARRRNAGEDFSFLLREFLDEFYGAVRRGEAAVCAEGTTAVQPMEKPMNTPKMPHTDSIAELARFWDMHDLTDFEDELEEVHESVFERRGEATVTIRLPTAEVEALKRLAKAKGVGHTALIQEWVREKLQHA